MSPFLTAVLIVLIPAGALPVVTAWFLRRYRKLDSQVLRDRWHVALVMAAVGVIVAFLAANRLAGWGIGGEWLVLPFAVALLAMDVVSGKWLYDYWTGGFFDRPTRGETSLEREDRKVGDTRRELQAENADKEDAP